MSTVQEPDRLSQLITAAEELLEGGIPVITVRPGGKAPTPSVKPDPDTGEPTWEIIRDPDDAEGVIRAVHSRFGVPNLAALAGHEKDSCLCVADMDGINGRNKAKELGVSSALDCWLERTGRGNHAAFFYLEPGLHLPRRIRAGGLSLDLITNGYQLVPPSITEGPYRWLEGHSPKAIPVCELAPPPPALIEWWQAAEPVDRAEEQRQVAVGAWALLQEDIEDDSGHSQMLRVAGWLRLYHPRPVVAELLRAVNEARCRPPMPSEDLERLVKSVFAYPQPGASGHPKAIVNPWRTGEAQS